MPGMSSGQQLLSMLSSLSQQPRDGVDYGFYPSGIGSRDSGFGGIDYSKKKSKGPDFGFGDAAQLATGLVTGGASWLTPATMLAGSLIGSIFKPKPKQLKSQTTTTYAEKLKPRDVFSNLGIVGADRDALNQVLSEAFINNLTQLMGARPFVRPGG